jgi:pimeloyl-ACP methyl ester carboxylesterase
MTVVQSVRLARQGVATSSGTVTAITKGSGSPLLLLHGVGGNAAGWSKQLDAFSTRFRTIAWDAPGYGGSDPFSWEQPVVEDYAAAVIEVLDAVGVVRADVVAHSMGGLIAGHVAAVAGDRVRRLILADCSSGHRSYAPAKRSQIRQSRLAGAARENPEAYARGRVAQLLSAAASQDVREEAVGILSQIQYPGFQQAASMVSDSDLFSVLPSIRAPTFVLCGDSDAVTTPDLNRQIAAGIQGAEFRLLPDCGHWSFLENPAAFNEAVLEFLCR